MRDFHVMWRERSPFCFPEKPMLLGERVSRLCGVLRSSRRGCAPPHAPTLHRSPPVEPLCLQTRGWGGAGAQGSCKSRDVLLPHVLACPAHRLCGQRCSCGSRYTAGHMASPGHTASENHTAPPGHTATTSSRAAAAKLAQGAQPRHPPTSAPADLPSVVSIPSLLYWLSQSWKLGLPKVQPVGQELLALLAPSTTSLHTLHSKPPADRGAQQGMQAASPSLVTSHGFPLPHRTCPGSFGRSPNWLSIRATRCLEEQ